MALSTVLWIALALRVAGAQEVLGYTPQLTSENLEGKITASTFVLDQPRCVFNETRYGNDGIWLLVAYSKAADNFNSSSSPSDLPYQQFEKNSLYMTLNTVPSNYPCPDPAQPSNQLTVLRVGNEVNCVSNSARPDCNGPLPGQGPYRVRFLAVNSRGEVTAMSRWSSDITLIQAEELETIDTSPGRRSAGMIALTSILSILFAILLAALIAALVYKYTDVCSHAGTVTMRESAAITRYTTHHIYDQPTQKL